jgi:Tat protein secretion system quality control protein TatD with DNase activity
MNPMPRRGEPSTSLDLGRTMAAAAEIKGMPLEELAAAAQANALRIFSEKRT